MNIKKTILLSIFCICGIAYGSNFEIDRVGKSSAYACVKGNWETGAPCIKARILSHIEIEGQKLRIRAYFYDKNKSQVDITTRPSSTTNGDGNSSMYPHVFEEDEEYDVYFGIPKTIRRGGKKWRYVIIVFGAKDDYVAKVYPKADLNNFAFKEKALVLKK